MLSTISSKNSLVFWDRNVNGSNIVLSVFDGDNLWMKPYYADMFNQVSLILDRTKHPNIICTDFVKNWHANCTVECGIVDGHIRNALAKHGFDAKGFDDAINKVINKFRGNLGEILVEAVIKSGFAGNEICEPSSYMLVDPTHEEHLDAEGVKPFTGIPVGIQVKNFSQHNKVDRKTFDYSQAMGYRWAMCDPRITSKNFDMWRSTPTQFIISLTDAENDMLVEDNRQLVTFCGPKWWKKLHLESQAKYLEASMMFKAVADEIDSLKA